MTRPTKPHSILDTHRPLRLTQAQYRELDSDMIGICRACGAERDTCEPDAEGYPCPTCGSAEVYGVEQLLIREEVEIIP